MTMPEASYDAVITDPPYASGGLSSAARAQDPRVKYQLSGTRKYYPTFANDNRDQRTHLMWSVRWMEQALRLTRPGGWLMVFADCWMDLERYHPVGQDGELPSPNGPLPQPGGVRADRHAWRIRQVHQAMPSRSGARANPPQGQAPPDGQADTPNGAPYDHPACQVPHPGPVCGIGHHVGGRPQQGPHSRGD